MTGPSDRAAGAGHGHLRASHADRERMIDVLKAAFVQGRLTGDELDARLAQAFASRTYAELAAVTADLPVGLIEAQLPARPARARAPADPAARSGLRVIRVATTLAAAAWLVAWVTGSAELFVMAISITIAWAGSLLLAGSVMLESRNDRPPRATYRKELL
jgi:Domain of unknown function (DUF1707)